MTTVDLSVTKLQASGDFLSYTNTRVPTTALVALLAILSLSSQIVGDIMPPLFQSFMAAFRLAGKRFQKIREDCFWHFMVWILNPYAFWLLIFWPGWIILGTAWLWCQW